MLEDCPIRVFICWWGCPYLLCWDTLSSSRISASLYIGNFISESDVHRTSIYVKSIIKHQKRTQNLKLWLPDSTVNWDSHIIEFKPRELSVRILKHKKGKASIQKCRLILFNNRPLGEVGTSLKAPQNCISANPFHRTTACRKESQGTYQEKKSPILISIISTPTRSTIHLQYHIRIYPLDNSSFSFNNCINVDQQFIMWSSKKKII